VESNDKELARRVRDIVAVAVEDIDSVSCEVEDGVAYIEGVVPTEQHRRAISDAVRKLDGLSHVITCLAAEHVMPAPTDYNLSAQYPAPVVMHYHNQS
jgi:osmotically-inducible protein OsmY